MFWSITSAPIAGAAFGSHFAAPCAMKVAIAVRSDNQNATLTIILRICVWQNHFSFVIKVIPPHGMMCEVRPCPPNGLHEYPVADNSVCVGKPRPRRRARHARRHVLLQRLLRTGASTCSTMQHISRFGTKPTWVEVPNLGLKRPFFMERRYVFVFSRRGRGCRGGWLRRAG